MLLRTDCKTFEPVIIVVFNYFVRFNSIAKIVFVENYYLLLLILFNNHVELGITTAIRNPRIANLNEHVDFVTIFFDQPQRFFHMSRKPVYVVL